MLPPAAQPAARQIRQRPHVKLLLHLSRPSSQDDCDLMAKADRGSAA
jgi:hypothetical protein